MQELEKDNIASESSENLESDMKAEPVDIFPETEETTDIEELSRPMENEVDQLKEESRARRIFRKFIRWTVGLLVVFGLGFLAAVFTIYTSKVDELAQYQKDLDTAGASITDLVDQISSLENQVVNLNSQIEALNQEIDDLESQKQALQADQNSFNLHIALLKAKADVFSAQVELYDGNPAQARVLLQNTDQTLTTIESLLPEDLKDVIDPLRTRLNLAIDELDTDPENAIKDLGILAGDLLEIENALFGE